MSIEVRPLGVKCNIGCQYCYQNPERDAGNDLRSYDMNKMMKTLREDGGKFILFGGEPLLMPIEDLEQLWKYGYQKHGKNGIQTNGTLITEEHIKLFYKYRVGVGMSMDGPGELNDIRWAGTLEKTRAATERSLSSIEMLCEAEMPPSLIVTLHRGNATADKLPVLLDWFRDLDRQGVKSARLHLMEVESEEIRERYGLSDEENIAAILAFEQLETELKDLRFDLFRDMRNMLLGEDNKNTCVWTGCDPYTTEAVQGLEGNGQRSNCGRTNKDGIDFVKAETKGWERYMALYQTPQDAGGCQGCRFFLMCKGQCPGTSLKGDWRNRTDMCGVIMHLYERLETKMVDDGQQPLSLHPQRALLEQEFLGSWSTGQHVSMKTIFKRQKKEKQKRQQKREAREMRS